MLKGLPKENSPDIATVEDVMQRPGASSLEDMCLRKIDSALPTPSYDNAEWVDRIDEFEVLRNLQEHLVQSIATTKLEGILEQPTPQGGIGFPTSPIVALQKVDVFKGSIDQAIHGLTWALIEILDHSKTRYLQRLKAKVLVIEIPEDNALPESIIPEIKISINSLNKDLQSKPHRLLVPLTTSGYSTANLWSDISTDTLESKDRNIVEIKLLGATQHLSPALMWFFKLGTIVPQHKFSLSIKVNPSHPELERQGLAVEGILRHHEIAGAGDYLWERSEYR